MIPDMAPIKARGLTDRIKKAVDEVWMLLEQAYATRAWTALGYDDWNAYCQAEFGTDRIALPKDRRVEVVTSMRETGMSTRAIAIATGLSQMTVVRDLTPGESNDSPGTPPAKKETVAAPAAEVAQESRTTARPNVTGTDGKTYAAATPSPQPRHVKKPTNIRAVVADALTDITRARNTLTALTREQITTQDEEARRTWAANLSESIEALTGFNSKLTKEQ